MVRITEKRKNWTRSPIAHRYSLARARIPDDAACVLDVGGYSSRKNLLTEGRPALKYVSANVGTAWYENVEYDLQIVDSAIPSAARAFDAVVSVDTLEHVPHAARERIVGEMMRVANKRVVVVVPFAPENTAPDELEILQVADRLAIEPMPSLLEHIQFGLPTLRELRELAASCGGTLEPATPRALYWSSQIAMHWNSAVSSRPGELNGKILTIVEELLRESGPPVDFRDAYRAVLTIEISDSE